MSAIHLLLGTLPIEKRDSFQQTMLGYNEDIEREGGMSEENNGDFEDELESFRNRIFSKNKTIINQRININHEVKGMIQRFLIPIVNKTDLKPMFNHHSSRIMMIKFNLVHVDFAYNAFSSVTGKIQFKFKTSFLKMLLQH